MGSATEWVDQILADRSPRETWSAIFERLLALAQDAASPVELHNQTVPVDRLLAETAWELWERYSDEAPRTAPALIEWWSKPSVSGRAVLVLDALSLRELPALLAGARTRKIEPTSVRVTGSEAPSETNAFAGALGAQTRSKLENNGAPGGFALKSSGPVFTDVLNLPFQDCLGSVPNDPNVFFWHTWLDDLIHVHQKLPDQIYRITGEVLQGEGFWSLVNRLRQGRRVLITADHGYAVSKLFSTEEKDEEVISVLRETFGASRCKPAARPWERRFMPPLAMTSGGHHVVVGQRKWKVQGGFPQACHGGLSLLEVAVPFVELPPLNG
ncbi:MAG: hypothetical protein HYU36_08495 [Planctomycetes bacterium]|nr:hypothetical protein [Planctomycetota bacterium]